MNPQEKLGAYNDLKDPRFYDADYELLKKKNSGHELSRLSSLNPIQYLESLHALLDYVTPDEILKNRKAYLVKLEKAAQATAEKAEKEAAATASKEKAAAEKAEKEAAATAAKEQAAAEKIKKEAAATAAEGEAAGTDPKKNKDKPSPGASSKKSKNTQGSGGTI